MGLARQTNVPPAGERFWQVIGNIENSDVEMATRAKEYFGELRHAQRST